jgi:uncharacterized protein
MNACPKCQTKIQESSNFCKKCGFKLSNSSFEDKSPFGAKKEKVLGEKKKGFPWVLISLAVAAVALAGVAYWIVQDKTETNQKVSQPKVKVSERVDYAGQTVRMTDIQAKVEKGKISIPVETVMEKKIVRLEYDGKDTVIPLVAYIIQSGKVVTAVSMCEPCRSTRFHIKEKTLVCNACATEWNLETLQGISGGCLDYPPDVLPSTIENGKILIDEKTVQQWKPRV